MQYFNQKIDSNFLFNEWEISEKEINIQNNLLAETIFSLGNGYIGMRGNFEEDYGGGEGTSLEGNYINGFFESNPIFYREGAYGYAKNSQTMLNITNGKIINFYIGNEKFNLFEGKILDYKRTLKMKEGILERQILWQSPKGKKAKIKIKRLVSLHDKHLAAIDYEIIPINYSGEVTIISALDGNVKNQEAQDDPRVGSDFKGKVLKYVDSIVEENFCGLIHKTTNTNFKLLSGMKNLLISQNEFSREFKGDKERIQDIFIIKCKENESIKLYKFITYFTTRDYVEDRLVKLGKEKLEEAENKGFDYYLEKQIEYLKDFWNDADVEIKGDEELQQGIRFNEYHLLQSVGKDGRTNIAAKGLTGEGYEGHYFWDTEIYIIPFFLYTKPEISRKLLEFRYNTLDKARQRARELAHKKGVLYPWRTIDGEECSAYYPAGTAQYHINADISYAVKTYIEVTDDVEFLLEMGAEIVFETARFWVDLGSYIPNKKNKFCINGVTGPDEYTAIVNNNCYTNYMAKLNLEYAWEIANMMEKKYPNYYRKLRKKIKLEDYEINQWKKAADNMYIPYDKKLQIHLQDDTFLNKSPWDFENTPRDKYPLLLHYHPLVIYRHQVLKQADIVLASFLLGDRFSMDDKKRDYDYYEPLTTHDSSLSSCIYSIMASEIGYKEKAYNYFMETARIDLDNKKNNSHYGIHTACMAGAWMSVINGFAGMRTYNGTLSFNPYIPEKWEKYRFKIKFRKRQLYVEINKKYVTYELLKGEKLDFIHKGGKISLKKGETIKLEI